MRRLPLLPCGNLVTGQDFIQFAAHILRMEIRYEHGAPVRTLAVRQQPPDSLYVLRDFSAGRTMILQVMLQNGNILLR